MSDKPYSISDAVLWALSRRALTPTGRTVLVALWAHVDWREPHTQVWPSRATIADRLGLTRARVCTAITELRTHGLVTSHGPRTSRLTLTPPTDGIAEIPRRSKPTCSDDRNSSDSRNSSDVRNSSDNRNIPCSDSRNHPHVPIVGTPCSDHRNTTCSDNRNPNAEGTLREHFQIITPSGNAERIPATAAPVGAGEDDAPLALIPPEHIEVRPPEPDPVDVVIAHANALAERVNRYWTNGELRMPKMAPRPNAARKRSPSPRTMIADRIADYGIDDVRYTLERYASICVHEPEQRKWWCPDMFSPTRWPPIRSTVANGTGKRFRNERDRHEWETRAAGRHDWPAVPRNVITYDDTPGEPEPYVPPDYMDDSKIPF
jgi:hypothetical protein